MKYLLIISLFICSFAAKSQDSVYRRPNSLKLNVPALAIGNYSVIYEYELSETKSALLGFIYHPASSPPVFFSLKNYLLTVDKNQFQGFAITPEFRHYITRCTKGNLKTGFYISGYFRYSSFTLNAIIRDKIPVLNSYFVLDAKLAEYGIGMQIGYQVVLNNRFTVDFMAFGPRVARYHYILETRIEGTGDLAQNVEDFINQKFDDFYIPQKIDITTNERLSRRFNFINFRYGVSLGYKF